MEDESETALASHKSLCNYAKFLKREVEDLIPLDWLAIHSDLEFKLYFSSSIPQGYGVGSSGALVAAFYDRYAIDKISPQEVLTSQKLNHLKSIFAAMESYFHGESSGLDPLNSYLSLPLLIHSKEKIETISLPEQNIRGKGAVFLIDTGRRRETTHMVSLFMKKMKAESFSRMMQEEFIELTGLCVKNFLNSNTKLLLINIKYLSALVFKYFKPMIPLEFHGLWKKGLETNSYYLKLCGSGGGGYMLGFAEDFKIAQKTIGRRLELVYYL